MNRLMNRPAGWLAVGGAVLLALAPAISTAQTAEQPPRIIRPDGKSSDSATNIDNGKSEQIREDLIKQQLRHNYFRPYNPQMENPLDGMFVQPSRPELTPEQERKLKESSTRKSTGCSPRPMTPPRRTRTTP